MKQGRKSIEKSEFLESEFRNHGVRWFAGIYFLLVQPFILFVLPLVRYDEFRLVFNDPLFGFSVSIDAWRNFFITVYGIKAGLMLCQNHSDAAKITRRCVFISLASAFVLLIWPFLIPFHSILRKQIRIDQATLFLGSLAVSIGALLCFKRTRFFDKASPWNSLTCRTGGMVTTIGLALVAGAFLTRPNDIFEAAWAGDVKAVEGFVKRGVEVNGRTWDENSPLHFAKSKELAEYLMSVECPVDIRNRIRETPLHLAAFEGRAEVSLVLVEHGAEVNTTNWHGLTPLDHAFFGKSRSWRGDYDTVIALLAAKGGKTGAEVKRDAENALKARQEGSHWLEYMRFGKVLPSMGSNEI